MQKFFKGQEVQIKKLKDIKNPKDWPTLAVEMEELCGEKGKIDSVDQNFTWGHGDFTYLIFGWSWRAEWIETEDFLDEKDFEI